MSEYALHQKFSTCTTQGCLSKAWYISSKGEKVLVKGNTSPEILLCQGYEPYSEALAFIVARALGLPAIPYRLAEKGLFEDVVCSLPHVSVCPFIQAPIGYRRVSAMELIKLMFPLNCPVEDYDSLDIWTFYTKLPIDLSVTWNMLLFDAIVGNTDRHLRNWEFFVSYKDGCYGIKPCPIFDNGLSLLSRVPDYKLSLNFKLGLDCALPFKDTHVKQIRLIKRYYPAYRHDINANKVWGIISSEIQTILRLMPEKRAECVTKYLHNRLFYFADLVRGD